MGVAFPDPTWTIIVPTYERPDRLRDCLASLSRLTYPCDRFEVIVVDDGSRTSPTEVVASWRAQLQIRLVAQEHAGPAAARNKGAEAARGTFLAFTDDDCLVTPDWLDRLETRLRESPWTAVGGRTVNAYPDNLCSTVSQLITDVLYAYQAGRPGFFRFVTSNNFAVPRAVFLEIGGFDPSFPLAAGEDREFCARWVRGGYRLVTEEGAVVYHRHWLTLSGFWRQQFGYGRGAYRFHRACARGNLTSHCVGPDFLGHLLRSCFNVPGFSNRCLAATLLAASQAAIATGMAVERLSARRSA
jgi:glycosyltransferase involved in cell wall biosynthesis